MKDTINKLSILSISKAAALLGVGKSTLNELINSGKIGIIQINGKRKISYRELERFLSENTVYQSTSSEEIPFTNETSSTKNKRLMEFDSNELFNRMKGEYLNG